KVVPFPLAPKIIDHQESAVEQVVSQDRNFLLIELQPSWFDDVNERVIEQFLVGEFEHQPFRIHSNRSHLVEAKGKIQIAVGKIDFPAVKSMASPSAVLNANKSEHVLLEPFLILPLRRRRAVFIFFTSGALAEHDAGGDCKQQNHRRRAEYFLHSFLS